MIMPVKAFEEFCAHHQVQHLRKVRTSP
ncbi:phenol hydroxylase subunit [Escherichia coli]